MEFLEKSLIITYWKYSVPFFLIIFSLLYLFRNKKEEAEENGSERKLAEEEYIGEFESDVNNDTDDLTPALEDNTEHIPYAGATITLPGGAKEFFEIVNNRRSVREFSQKPVDFKIIEQCIKAAGTSPSGAHTEPWTFCVVSNQDIKSEIRRIVEDEEYQNYTQRMSRQWTTDLKPLKTYYIKEYLTDAPYLILVFKQIHGFRDDGVKKQHYYNEISVSIATGILLSALQCAGLNSLTTTPLNCGPALRNLLNRPNNEKLLLLIPVGYASENCMVPDFKRKDVNDILIKY